VWFETVSIRVRFTQLIRFCDFSAGRLARPSCESPSGFEAVAVAARAGEVIAAAVTSATAGFRTGRRARISRGSAGAVHTGRASGISGSREPGSSHPRATGLPAHIRPIAEPSTAAAPGAGEVAKRPNPFISERVVIVRTLEHFGELKPRATHGTDPRPSWH